MSVGEVLAFFTGLVTFPALVILGTFLLVFVATYVESGVLGFLFVVIASGVLWWTGANVFAVFVAHPILTAIGIIAYLPIGYLWGIKFNLPREARKDAAKTKAKIEQYKPDFVSDCKQWLEADDTRDFFVGLPMVTKTVEVKGRYVGNPESKQVRVIQEDAKAQLLAALKKDNDAVPETLEPSFRQYLERKGITKPSALKYKDRLMCWIVFWFWSVIAYVCTELLHDFFSFIWRKICSFFDSLWRYLTGIVTRVIDKAYAEAGIDHLVTNDK